MRKRQVTSTDVARVAGVSQSAVSRTFTPGASVSEKTRQKVLAATRLLGYQPNALARGLITQRSNIIGVVVGDTVNPFYSAVLEEATRRIQAAGRQVMLFLTTADLDPGEALPQALQYQVDGVVISTALLSPRMAMECAKVGTPMVLINRSLEGFDVPTVHCDHRGGVRAVADLLVDGGHRRIAFVNGVASVGSNQIRREGFIGRLAERGVRLFAEDAGHFTYEGGFRAAVALLSGTERPDAIFCACDTMALGVMDAARAHFGLRIPDDLSVAGFDDVPAAARPGVRLTTVHADPQGMAARAVDKLLRMIDAGTTRDVSDLFPVHLVVRGSTRPARGGADGI